MRGATSSLHIIYMDLSGVHRHHGWGTYFLHFSLRFLYIVALEGERTQAVVWEVLCVCPTSVAGAQDAMLAVRATSHNLDICRLHMIHDLITFASPSSQSSLFSSCIPPSCATLTALTTHNGSTPPNIPINLANPPLSLPSPSFILPSHTSTISTPLHPLHHR